MSPRTWIAAVAVIATTATSPPVRADGKNEVRAVTFDEDGGITRVHVRGAQTPTFTVYKLDRPSRVVIDLPQARLAEALRGHETAAVFTPGTWAVSTIAAQQLDDGAVRVIITLARPGRYDVKTDGNEVVVMVMPRDAAPKTTSPAELEQAKQQTQAAELARAEAERGAAAAKSTAARAMAEADRLRKVAAEQTAKAEAAQRAVDQVKQQTTAANAADLERMKAIAVAAKAEAARASAAADRARRDALAEADRAKADAARARDELARSHVEAQQEIAKTRAEAEQARSAAAKTTAEAEQARSAAAKTTAEAEQAKTDAAHQRAEAEVARRDAAKTRAEAEQVKTAAEQTMTAARRTQAESDRARDDAEQARREAAQRRTEAEAAKADAARAKTEAAAARSDAEAARAAAAVDKRQAEADKQKAEQLLAGAKQQLAVLEKKTATTQELEDKARAAHAAAQAREDAARDAEAQAMKERTAAETAAKHAQDARDKAAATDRAKLVADAKAAEDRLAKARRATDDAEAKRQAAEHAAQLAQHDLEQTKSALAGVEDQRAAAVAAATDAARKRSEAEAAAIDAARRRTEAETAAAEATKHRSIAEAQASDAAARRGQAERDRAAAEAQRAAAVQAAQAAQLAKAAAEHQRQVAEASANSALAAKHDAEVSLAELVARRQAAEHAAAEVDTRTKAEAKAQADVAAAKTAAGIAAARADLARLADERKQAETELADRRKAVALQQAEATRLATAAAQAGDTAAREETRRAKLADQDLAKLQARKVQTQVAVAPKLARLSGVAFKGEAGSGQVELAFVGDVDVQLGEVTSTHVELIIDHAEVAPKLERTLDVSRFGSPVRTVSSFRDRRTPDRVRLVAELAQPATPTIDRDATGVRLRLVSTDVAKRPAHTQSFPPTVVGGFGAASTPVAQQSVSQVPPAPGGRRRIYHGATVDFDFKDAPIHDLLRIIADTGHVNIVVPDTISAKVTVRLKRVPWDQALEVILASQGLWFRREGNLYRIAPRKELDTEDEAEAARREAAVKAEAPKPEVVTLNYADSSELKGKLEGMLSPKGKIEVDGRTNALIINDVAGNREQIARLALQLDTQTPQITIEARIVEARSTFIRQFGVQWGGNALAGAAGGNATGLVFPSTVALAGGNDDNQTRAGGVSLPSDFAINLPAATGSGEGGAMGLSLGSIGGNLNINLRLSALEDSGTIRIISAPKITVLNNKQAEIRQGVSIPISVVSAAGTQTQFVQADLKLTVTPYVSQRDCAIAMNLEVTKNEPDFVNVGARGDPTILRKEAKTTMLVNDGETTVLGGIYTRNTGLAYKKVPFFGDLPFIGWFFKNRRENDDRTEILVFITPKITNKASLRCVADTGFVAPPRSP